MGKDKLNKVWLGADVGGTKLLVHVYDRDVALCGKARTRTQAREGAKAGVQRMIDLIDEALGDAGVARDAVKAIGVGAPGPLDLNEGVILDLPNLGWSKVPIKRWLETAFHCPVTVINDVDAGLFGEYRFGAARGSRCCIGAFPGTGIGGACVYEGRLLRGARASAMELGHMRMVANGALCGCGNRGCLETVASRLSIAAAAAAAAYRGEAPYLLKTTGMDLANIRSGALRDSIANGDRVVEQIVRHAARMLGTAIGNAINLLAPDRVVLGGGLVQAMPDLFVTESAAAAAETVMPSYRKTYTFQAAELGDDACVKGAAAWAMDAAS